MFHMDGVRNINNHINEIIHIITEDVLVIIYSLPSLNICVTFKTG